MNKKKAKAAIKAAYVDRESPAGLIVVSRALAPLAHAMPPARRGDNDEQMRAITKTQKVEAQELASSFLLLFLVSLSINDTLIVFP